MARKSGFALSIVPQPKLRGRAKNAKGAKVKVKLPLLLRELRWLRATFFPAAQSNRSARC